MYLILPNSTEVSLGITDANFLLALSALLLVLARSPRGLYGRLFDCFIWILCGLSGPFCIFLMPISVFLAWKQRDRRRTVPVIILTGCCLIQAWALLVLAPTARSHRPFGSSPGLFARILGGRVYLGVLLGGNGLASRPGLWVSGFLACVAVGGTAIIAVCLAKSPLAMRVFLLFSALLFVSSLIDPVEWGRPDLPVWTVLAGSPGHRYWFFATLAFAWALLWGFHSRITPVRVVASAHLCLMYIGILRVWRHPAIKETHLAECVRRFDAAPRGAVVTIQEYPDGWSLNLVKHTSTR